jgi:hypothetical protein
LLKCGEESIFFSRYSAQVNTSNQVFISIHNSPVCIPLLNYNNINNNTILTYQNVYKILPVDYNSINALDYEQSLSNYLNLNISYLNDVNIFLLLLLLLLLISIIIIIRFSKH